MDKQYIKKALVKIICSVLCAGVLYFLWLAAFLLTAKENHPALRAFFWVFTPLATAVGFTAGIVLFERRSRKGRGGLLRIFIWPFVGCAVGAGVVYWFGPMLIVFGMFALGTASLILREILRISA